MLEKTGKVPPLDSTRILPTSEGHDSRWHAKLGRYQSSACWECHARHMVEYELGQSLDRDLPWAPDPPRLGETPIVRSVFHTVFHVLDGRRATHPLAGADAGADRPGAWKIQYGFEQATVGAARSTDMLQQHVRTLSEEAGKFIGRHNVRIDWIGHLADRRVTIAREERQVTVKDYRARNHSIAMWIDFASTLQPAAGTVKLDGAAGAGAAGFRFVPSLDAGMVPEMRESAAWRAITFVSEGSTYTAVCISQSGNPPPPKKSAQPAGTSGPAARSGSPPEIGYRFSAECTAQKPLQVHYRLWIQGGRMPTEDIEALANDFLEPIRIEVE